MMGYLREEAEIPAPEVCPQGLMRLRKKSQTAKRREWAGVGGCHKMGGWKGGSIGVRGSHKGG